MGGKAVISPLMAHTTPGKAGSCSSTRSSLRSSMHPLLKSELPVDVVTSGERWLTGRNTNSELFTSAAGGVMKNQAEVSGGSTGSSRLFTPLLKNATLPLINSPTPVSPQLLHRESNFPPSLGKNYDEPFSAESDDNSSSSSECLPKESAKRTQFLRIQDVANNGLQDLVDNSPSTPSVLSNSSIHPPKSALGVAKVSGIVPTTRETESEDYSLLSSEEVNPLITGGPQQRLGP